MSRFLLDSSLYYATPGIPCERSEVIEDGCTGSSNWMEVTARLVLALLVGAVIGLERESSATVAGLRTHRLISFGAALFVLIST